MKVKFPTPEECVAAYKATKLIPCSVICYRGTIKGNRKAACALTAVALFRGLVTRKDLEAQGSAGVNKFPKWDRFTGPFDSPDANPKRLGAKCRRAVESIKGAFTL